MCTSARGMRKPDCRECQLWAHPGLADAGRAAPGFATSAPGLIGSPPCRAPIGKELYRRRMSTTAEGRLLQLAAKFATTHRARHHRCLPTPRQASRRRASLVARCMLYVPCIGRYSSHAAGACNVCATVSSSAIQCNCGPCTAPSKFPPRRQSVSRIVTRQPLTSVHQPTARAGQVCASWQASSSCALESGASTTTEIIAGSKSHRGAGPNERAGRWAASTHRTRGTHGASWKGAISAPLSHTCTPSRWRCPGRLREVVAAPRRSHHRGWRLAVGAVRLRSNKWMHVSNIACSADKSSGSTHLHAHRGAPSALATRQVADAQSKARCDGMAQSGTSP